MKEYIFLFSVGDIGVKFKIQVFCFIFQLFVINSFNKNLQFIHQFQIKMEYACLPIYRGYIMIEDISKKF